MIPQNGRSSCQSHLFFLFEENSTMEDKTITVTCPKCGIKMTNPSSWFKKPGNCCPGCQLRFSTERFKRCIEEAEKLA